MKVAETTFALDKMEDSEQGLMRSKSDQKQLKEKEQLKVAAWAVCKESNIAKGEGQSMVHSVCATVPGKRLNESDKLKKENDPRDVSKIFASPCSVEGLERKPIVCCEDRDLKTTAKAEGGQRDKLVGLATPKIENVDDCLKVKEEVEFGEESREQKMKEKVEIGEERKEGKCFKFEDSKDRCEGVHKTQVKAKALESMHVWLNEESQSQVKAEYEEGGKAKDIGRKRQPRATEDVEKTQAKAEYEEGSRREHIVEVSSVLLRSKGVYFSSPRPIFCFICPSLGCWDSPCHSLHLLSLCQAHRG